MMSDERVHVPPAEFARLVSVSPMTVYRMVKQGRIPFIRIGSSVRIDPVAAVAALQKKQEGRSDD